MSTGELILIIQGYRNICRKVTSTLAFYPRKSFSFSLFNSHLYKLMNSCYIQWVKTHYYPFDTQIVQARAILYFYIIMGPNNGVINAALCRELAQQLQALPDESEVVSLILCAKEIKIKNKYINEPSSNVLCNPGIKKPSIELYL